MRFRSLPIFWQTLILLLGGLAVAQIDLGAADRLSAGAAPRFLSP